MARLDDVVSPIVYPEGVSDGAVEKAVKLSKNLRDHIELHYGIFASQDLAVRAKVDVVKAGQMTALDLIHYHVYGDYRLCMAPTEADVAPEYLKTPFPTTQLRYKAITPDPAPKPPLLPTPPDIKSMTDLNYLNSQMLKENFDMLHGSMGTTGIAPSETEWFIRELAFGSSASKFHLPSLGTMAITNYAYKNINDVLGKALAESVLLMMETIMFDREKLPKALEDTFDASALYGITADEEINGNPLLFNIGKAITLNQEYLELRAQYPQVPSPSKIMDLVEKAYGKDDMDEAVNYFCKELLSMSNMKYTVGVPVSLKSGAATIKAEAPNYPDLVDGLISLTEAEGILSLETFYVVDARAGPVYDILMETGTGEEFQINNVPEAQLELAVGTVEAEGMLDKARGKKGGKFTHPSLLVFQRIALDVIFSIEALIAVCTVPHKFYLISPKINIVQKQKSVANYYPRMAKHITGAFSKDMGPPTLEFLSSIRLQHTIANIANSEKLILDSRTMEEFYRQDLRMAETLWLASALTDAGKVVFEKKELPNLLAQMQYRAKGVGGSVDYSEANIKPESVFYQIDSPILKDVIMQFDSEFVKFTVMNAFAPKGKKKKKGGGGGGSGGSGGSGGGNKKQDGVAQQINALAAAVWGSIERRAGEIVNRPGIKPHILFNRLFSKLDRLNITSTYIRDNYPPKWVGTNTVTLLRSPPEVLGEKLDMKFYTDCMDEFIRHLKLLYKAQPEIPILILQTITEVVVDGETDIDTLRESFIARIKSQASKPFLKGTSTMFDPFRYVIMIMRTEIDVPLAFREEYVARKLDEEQKKSIKNTFSSMGEKVILPEDHPEFKEKEVEVDEESALYGLPNPYAMPLPAYYPKPGEELNRKNKKVMRMIRNKVGSRSDPNWPNGFQIAVGVGGITAATSIALKDRLLDSSTQLFANPISWRGAEQIWDGREKSSDKANPSAVAHFRNTLGIEFRMVTPGYPDYNIEFVPSNDLTNYNSIIYKKYLKDKYDEASYVYIPTGDGVFKNPSVFRGSKRIETVKGTVDLEELSPIQRATLTEEDLKPEEEGGFAELFRDVEVTYEMDFEDIDDPFDGLSSGGTMIFKGTVADLERAVTKVEEKVDLPAEEVTEEVVEEVAEEVVEEAPIDDVPLPPPEGYDEEGRFLSVRGDDDFEIITREDDDEPEVVVVEPAPVNVSMQGLEEPINRLSSSVDLAASEFGAAATKFEGAADAFESASGNLLQASKYFKEASDEFAKLPEAIKNSLEQREQRLEDKISEINPKILEGALEEISEEEFGDYMELAEEDLSGTGVTLVSEYAELTFSTLPELLKKSRYNYKEFKKLKPLVNNDLSANFDVVIPTVKTKKQTLNWISDSFVATLRHLATDKALDVTMLNKKEREEYNWRQYILGVMEVAKDKGRFLPMLGITPAD